MNMLLLSIMNEVIGNKHKTRGGTDQTNEAMKQNIWHPTAWQNAEFEMIMKNDTNKFHLSMVR